MYSIPRTCQIQGATSCTRPFSITISGLPLPASRQNAASATDWLCCSQLLGEDFLTIFRGWHIGSRAAGCCFSPASPLHPRQPPLSFAPNSQTSAHRRLSAAVHSTQKNLKTRKTRPFIDSLVEGSLQIYTVRYHHHHRSHCARARTGSIAQLFPGLVTDSAHAVLYLSPDTRYPFNTLDKRTWALFFVPSRSGNSRISCCISCRIASDAT